MDIALSCSSDNNLITRGLSSGYVTPNQLLSHDRT